MYSPRDRAREVENAGRADSPWRSGFRRDYARIIHSSSFRRLQGKTQVFPGHESDFFRNRLTHSLEVSQISEGIAEMLNYTTSELKDDPLDARLCAAAGLIHDIGHPPFGHNGERALDHAMREYGGFEGNAQTLRIVSKLEKKTRRKTPENADEWSGLNLCYRTLAAVLKYDREIPLCRRSGDKLVKGYYAVEADLVSRIKSAVTNDVNIGARSFKTVECAIMDLADDIAYSTYDLEDCLKAGFLTPIGMLASDDDLLKKVAEKVGKNLALDIKVVDIVNVFREIFQISANSPENNDDDIVKLSIGYKASKNLAESGYLRTGLSSDLVSDSINDVVIEYDNEFPAFSRVKLKDKTRLRVEVLKTYTFEATIYSSRVKLAEFRGFDLVKKIFRALASDKGDLLMPDDVRALCSKAESEERRKRVICDFVAGMTDRYAIEFYRRLHSDDAQSMFKPI